MLHDAKKHYTWRQGRIYVVHQFPVTGLCRRNLPERRLQGLSGTTNSGEVSTPRLSLCTLFGMPMELLDILTQWLGFAKYRYSTSAHPFDEIKRKIEKGEPYVDLPDPEWA